MKRLLKLISLICFVVFICPLEPLYCIPFLVFTGLFVVLHLNGCEYFKVKPSTINILSSLILNLALTPIFISRWSAVLESNLLLFAAIGLAFAGTPAVAFLILAFRPKTALEKPASSSRLSLREILLCVVSSCIILLVCTLSSPLVPFNHSCDANCMFTIGRGILAGKTVYKDLIDQKGPLIFYLHAAGALISSKSYIGIWIFEWIACLITMLFGIKIRKLFIKSSNIAIDLLSVAMTASVYCSYSFLYGDTSEGYVIPLILCSLYLCFKSILDSDYPMRRFILIGIEIGLIFWSKYTLCGAYVGLALFFLVLLIKDKNYKNLIRMVISVIAGFVLVAIPILFIFWSKNALNDLIRVYFTDNIFNYNMSSSSEFGLATVSGPFVMLGFFLSNDFPIFILILIGQVYVFYKNRKLGLMSLMSFFTCFVFAFIGAKSYSYYSFILAVFATLGWAPAILMFKYVFSSIKNTKTRTVTAGISAFILFLLAIPNAPNIENLCTDISENAVYGCSQIISQYDNPTLLCYGFLDRGFYTYNDIIPDVPYFTFLNANSEFIMQEQDRYIREGDYDFIITEGVCREFEGYTLIYTDPLVTKSGGGPYYLYQKAKD